MASSGNFMTFNSLAYQNSYSASYSKLDTGNLQGYATSGGWGWPSNFTFDSGKWYCEFYIYRRTGASIGYVAVVDHYYPHIDAKYNDNRHRDPTVNDYTVYFSGRYGDDDYAAIFNNDTDGGSPSQTTSGWWADGTIIGVALDLDSSTQTVQFYRNGSAEGNAETLNANASGSWAFWSGSHNASWHTMNAGQDSSFAGRATAQGNADENGFGDFYYTPPSGFLAPCTANLPVSDDIDPAQTDDDYPAKNFNAVAYTGNQTDDRAVTCGFKPDLVWLKQRASFSNPGILTDSSRGATKRIESYAAIAEATDSDGLKSFTSDGFTLGTNDKYNWTSDHTYVAWCWKANGGVTSSNTNGSITSTVQANTKGGFSIMTYTGTGSNATIGHGLSAKPDFILTKRRSSEQTWGVYHSALGATKYLALNSNAAAGTDSAFWNDTEPTTSVISLGTEGRVNANSQTYVAYAWHNVDGYSKFGLYEGNADDDGPFVYTGFRPRMLWIKEADNADDWVVYDTARDPFNRGSSRVVRFESNVVEFDGATRAIDILSNGFKIRTSNNTINQSSTFVWGCWGDVPFKYNNTF